MSSEINIRDVLHSICSNIKPIEWSKLQSEQPVHMQDRMCVWTVGQFVDVDVFVVLGEQMALPLTPPCVFLSPSWTTAWGGPYLVKLGGGEGKALKARLCGDAIRQTAVGPQTPPLPPSLPLLSNTPYCPSSAVGNRREMLTEQPRLLDMPWELCGRYHVESFPFPNHKSHQVIKHSQKPEGFVANFPPWTEK